MFLKVADNFLILLVCLISREKSGGIGTSAAEAPQSAKKLINCDVFLS